MNEAELLAVLAKDPAQTDCRLRLADLYTAERRFEEAYQHIARCQSEQPGDASTLNRMAAVCGYLGRHHESRRYLYETLSVAPHCPTAHWNLALNLLATGEWERGWQEYEWGRACGLRTSRHTMPEWDGKPLPAGSTLYLWAEQGMGDTLMLLRLVSKAREAAGDVFLTVEVQEALLPLLLPNAGPTHRFVAMQDHGGFVGRVDAHCSLFSLPRVLGINSPADMAFEKPYILVPEAYVLPAAQEHMLQVGVCWQGNPGHVNDKARSMGREAFEPILQTPGCEFYSLMPGVKSGTPEAQGMVNTDLTDFGVTAGIIAALDLVVTVDTSIAHLAGAMDKPVYLLLSKDCDWRWGLKGHNTPLYSHPITTLYRQSALNDWAPVVEAVAHDLGNLAEIKRTRQPE